MYLAEYMKDTYQCCCLYTIYRAFAEEEKAAVESYGVWSSDQCAHVLDLTAKACLTYETMHLVLTKSNLAGKVAIYDSSSSTYLTCVRSVAQTLITLLPEGARPSPRVQTYESGLGAQVDSYNCGVYVLLAFEMFCGAESLGHLDKKSLQCLRYRYLYMWMQA
ncbi:hypothetical protein PC121_g7490 [Phytophthora cactorum]|nr:hypothetical protein PC121_g7490 [Phytophthora cactorum]